MKPYLIFFCLSCLGLQSCVSLLGKIAGLDRTTAKVSTIKTTNKDVSFVQMAHLGKREFYKDVEKHIIDYQNKGYVMFLEGSPQNDSGKTTPIDTLAMKKLRKITNTDFSLSYTNHPLSGVQELVKKYELIDQPSYSVLGVKNGKYVDMLYPKTIDYFEKKYGLVVLDSCDISTPLAQKYKCSYLKELSGKFIREIMIDLRNKHLAEQIRQSNDNKILVIYGKRHLKGLRKELAKL
jgi:hypothetical protein